MKKNVIFIILVVMILLVSCGVLFVNFVNGKRVAENTGMEADGNDTGSTGDAYIERVSQSVIDNMAAPTALDNIKLTDEQLDAGIFNEGNKERLMKVMEKAAGGEEITIAYIGGSITNGDAASPKAERCYAYLTTRWWEESFPDAKVNYVNAGIGGTDSYLGVSRVKNDVLKYNPDLVVVEFSVNDGDEINKETYECLLRDILLSESEPAVVSLLLTIQSGYDKSNEHALVAHNYQVPIIAYSYLVKDLTSNGIIKWDQIVSSDGVHPNNGGHSLIANLLTRYYSRVLAEINTAKADEYTVNESKLTKCRFENSHIIFANEAKVISNNGFTETETPWYIPDSVSFVTENRGSISFEVSGQCIGLFYLGRKDGLGGQWDVYKDGEKCNTINADNKDGWGDAIQYIVIHKSDEVGTHTIELVPAEDSTGDMLCLIGIAVSE